MEEDKAAAYYDELTRKGGAAARFKQGLGFSGSSSSRGDPPARGSALPTSSFLSNFVKASSPTKSGELCKRSQLEKIQQKLQKKEPSSTQTFSVKERERRERDSDGERRRERNSRSRDREGKGSGRSRSRSVSDEKERPSRRRYRSSSRDRKREMERRRSRSRSLSPRGRRLEKGIGGGTSGVRVEKKEKDQKNGAVDYARLIEGYDNMTPAERVKAKMKFQLSETAQKDSMMGGSSGWERFEFDKDAPLDDEEIEVADDDAAVVKRIGHSFRFANIEARREEEIKAAHDAAMFGTPAVPHPVTSESEQDSENERREAGANDGSSDLMSDKVVAKQHDSWRDRARRSGR